MKRFFSLKKTKVYPATTVAPPEVAPRPTNEELSTLATLVRNMDRPQSRKSNQSRRSNQSRNSNQSPFTLDLFDDNDIDRETLSDDIDAVNFNILTSSDDILSNTLRLVLKSNDTIKNTLYIYRLLRQIEKMGNLEELEFSNFEIDVNDFLKNSGGIPFEVLFFSILNKLTTLKRITFNYNIFTDAEKKTEFDDFHERYLSKDGVYSSNLDRISLIIEWMIKNPVQNIASVFDAYKAYIHYEFWKTHVQQQQKINEGTKISDRRSNLPKISDVKFDDFLKNKEAVKRWLIWLIKNESDIRVKGDIVERLRIVIEYFKYNIYVIQFLSENPSLQYVIISEFDKIWHTYQPNRINDDYNRMIKDVLGNKLVKSRGGRKAPKKPPKIALKESKKPPKIARKAPKKQPKIARKVNKKK